MGAIRGASVVDDLDANIKYQIRPAVLMSTPGDSVTVTMHSSVGEWMDLLSADASGSGGEGCRAVVRPPLRSFFVDLQ